MNSFSVPGLDERLLQAFSKLGFSSPTRVQSAAIPLVLEGADLVISSETGTGKTFAYLAPIFESAKSLDPTRGPVALILCPTQELAIQVCGQAEALSEASGLGLVAISLLGGSPLSRQQSALKRKPSIVVATPGRALDLADTRDLRLDSIRYLVLDEADRLFGKEYRDAVESILKRTSKASRILASATIREGTKAAAAPYLRSPRFLDLTDEGVLGGDIEHWVFYVQHRKKLETLKKLERALRPERCLVFASSSDRVERASNTLESMGLAPGSLLSSLHKESRRVAIDKFARGESRYLVTSDLGARGLDIAGISHVVSLDFPEDASWYVHRAGRTGRAGLHGVSILLADGVELKRASRLAVDRGFVFRTKALIQGTVAEPTVEEFFAEVERGEEERRSYLAGRERSPRKRA
ncbi:MAG TPA: DEAD/DEAH box helicase [Rectinemataceae bacterium]